MLCNIARAAGQFVELEQHQESYRDVSIVSAQSTVAAAVVLALAPAPSAKKIPASPGS